jgi:hypothetical protein
MSLAWYVLEQRFGPRFYADLPGSAWYGTETGYGTRPKQWCPRRNLRIVIDDEPHPQAGTKEHAGLQNDEQIPIHSHFVMA